MRADRRARLSRALLAAATALAMALSEGCSNPPCIRHSDCDPGLVCAPTGACLVPVDPDGGSVAVDAGVDAATDAAPDGPADAAVDADGDAVPPPILDSDYADPIVDDVGQPHDLSTVTPRTGVRR